MNKGVLGERGGTLRSELNDELKALLTSFVEIFFVLLSHSLSLLSRRLCVSQRVSGVSGTDGVCGMVGGPVWCLRLVSAQAGE